MAENNRPEPFLGLWGWLVAIGLALVAFAHLIRVLSGLGDLPNEDVAPVLFSAIGSILAGLSLAAAGLWGKSPSAGIRVALLLGGCYFMLSGGSIAAFFGLFN